MRYINVYTQFFITLYAAFFFVFLLFVNVRKHTQKRVLWWKKKQQYQQLCLDGIFKAITTFHICHCDVRARVCAFICFNSKQLIILFHSKVWPSQFLLWQRRSHDNEQRNTPDARRYATLECVCVCVYVQEQCFTDSSRHDSSSNLSMIGYSLHANTTIKVKLILIKNQ